MSTSEKSRPLSVCPLLSGAYVPPCLKTWHGCSLSFTSAIPAFYADNSFQKTTKLQQKLTDARLVLVKKHLIARARVERVKVQQEQQAAARSLRAQQRRFERELRASSTARHNAAAKIQKVVRGWLCRRDTERKLIASGRERALKEVQSLEDFAHWWYLTSEREIAQRARVIQRAFRRYRRLKMLAVVARAYAIMLEREQCALSLTVSCVYRRFLAARRFRLELVLLTRDANLQRIRRKLACLRIAGCWRRLGMSAKLLRMRIRRFVRRLRARRKGRVGTRRVSMECDSPSAPLSSYTSPKGEALLSLDSDAGEAYNRSMYSSMRSSSPEDRGRITIGAKMNALGFHQPKDFPLCPLLRRLESPATPESVFSRLLATTECANQRSSTSHSHRTAFSHRRTATATPTVLQLSRFSAGTPASSAKAKPSSQTKHRYMDATESFAAAMESRADEEEVAYKRRLHSRWHPKGNVFGQTACWAQKRRAKSRTETAQRRWRPFLATSDPEPILSLDNSAYRPLPSRRATRRPLSSVNQRRDEISSPEEAPGSVLAFHDLTPTLFSAGQMPAGEHLAGL